jgi:type IV secretion system protein VirB8
MTVHDDIDFDEATLADSWSRSVTEDLERSRRTAWIVAAVAGAIALLLAIALVTLMPLKTVQPYTLLVDRQTGNVEALAPLDEQVVAPDAALTRSFLVQYVIARESFYAGSFPDDYQKVALWTGGEERQRYIGRMQATNPLSPLSFMPNGGTLRTEVKSVSSLGAGRSLVRFSTVRQDPGAQPQLAQNWVAVIEYGFSEAPMSEADRMLNPLGFQVTRYRRDAESLPVTVEVVETPATAGDAGR